MAVLIGSYLNHTSGDAWPSQTTLANDLGVTTRAIQKSLDALIGAGHLHREVPSLTLGRGHTNHYRPEFGALRTNAGSPFGDIKDEQGFRKGRTAEQGRANGCAIKDEPPFVQNTFKTTPLREHLQENTFKTEAEADLSKSGFTANVV